MEISDDQRLALAALVRRQRQAQFDTKLAAYRAAGLNSATWSRIEDGLSVRDHKLRAAVRTLWPETGGDWTAIPAAPAPDGQPGIDGRLSDLEDRVAAIERHLRIPRKVGEGDGQQPAAMNLVSAPGAPMLESDLPTADSRPLPPETDQ